MPETNPVFKFDITIPCPLCGCPLYKKVARRFDGGRLVRCKQCGHVYLNPIPNETILGCYRDSSRDTPSKVDSWCRDPSGPYYYCLDFLKKNGGISGKRVLDIGCGLGRFLFECREEGALVFGIDRDKESCRVAKLNYGLDIIPKSIEQVIQEGIFSTIRFDYIFCFEVIEHVKKPAELLRAAYEWLSPQGLLFLSTPNFSIYKKMKSASPFLKCYPQHIHYFTSDVLRGLLEKCGFELAVMDYCNSFTPKEIKAVVFMHNLIIRKIWENISKINIFYKLKDVLLESITPGSSWSESLEGQDIVCIARKK